MSVPSNKTEQIKSPEQARSHMWRKRTRKTLKVIGIMLLILGFIALIVIIILGYIFNWGWTGLGQFSTDTPFKDRSFQRGKTLWDWLQVLAIPIAVAVLTYTLQKRDKEREILQKKSEQEFILDNQQETALQTYIDKISDLLLKEGLAKSPSNSQVEIIAQTRTATVLHILNSYRRGSLIRFLSHANILEKCIKDELVGINLQKANLAQVNLSKTNLSGADLSEANLRRANLSEADLRGAFLIEADLYNANLSEANLGGTYLFGANLHNTILYDTTNLRKAKYNIQETQLEIIAIREMQVKTITIMQTTRWPQGFNPQAHGAICIDCKTP